MTDTILRARRRLLGRKMTDASGEWTLVAHTDWRGRPAVEWMLRDTLFALQLETFYAITDDDTTRALQGLLDQVTD